jgi:hypothetical protein
MKQCPIDDSHFEDIESSSTELQPAIINISRIQIAGHSLSNSPQIDQIDLVQANPILPPDKHYPE